MTTNDADVSARPGGTPELDPLRSGGMIAVAGPDGSGKSTFCDAFIADVLAGRPVRRIHFRPGLLPYATRHAGPVTEPHSRSAYGRPLSVLKTLYTYADFALGWQLRFRPFIRRGGWVVIERGWWDQIVDPLRYRLPTDPPLVRALGMLLPTARLTFVLEAPPAVLERRKAELSCAELARQMEAWRLAVPSWVRRTYLDSLRPAKELVRTAAAELASAIVDPTATERTPLVALPPGASARWLVPASTRRVAAGALRVYHPVTLRARIGWELARVVAATGLLRLTTSLATVTPAMRAVLRHTNDVAGVAVARTSHPGRQVALGVAREGEPKVVVKFASDAPGRMALERERVAISYVGSRLPAPVAPPEVLGYEDGVLALAAARWRPRLRPWRLPEDVAMAMGALFASDDAKPDIRVGMAHGDFAPWNLLRTDSGWVLIDWEDSHDDAPPFHDVFHYLVQSHVLLRRPSARAIRAGLRGKGWIGRAIRGYARGANLVPAEAGKFFHTYLLESSRRFDPSSPEGAMAIDARHRLMAMADV